MMSPANSSSTTTVLEVKEGAWKPVLMSNLTCTAANRTNLHKDSSRSDAVYGDLTVAKLIKAAANLETSNFFRVMA